MKKKNKSADKKATFSKKLVHNHWSLSLSEWKLWISRMKWIVQVSRQTKRGCRFTYKGRASDSLQQPSGPGKVLVLRKRGASGKAPRRFLNQNSANREPVSPVEKQYLLSKWSHTAVEPKMFWNWRRPKIEHKDTESILIQKGRQLNVVATMNTESMRQSVTV